MTRLDLAGGVCVPGKGTRSLMPGSRTGPCDIRQLIDAEDLDRLIAAAEDLADLEAARAAREEMAGGQPAIPWEDVKADLGLA